jgi:putative pre-16S rRNA nuclease
MMSSAIAALDVGHKRIGIAICEAPGGAAYPVGAIERRSTARDVVRLAAELGPRQVSRVIVGLPLNMDGSEGPRARSARAFASRLQAALGVPVELFDERLTSVEAEERMRLGSGRVSNKARIDAVAASVILEGWLAAAANAPCR